jgi:hypothetical protein
VVGNTACKLFADDIKLYSFVDCNGVSDDLNTSLNNLVLWSKTWQLNININKCNVLRIGKNDNYGDYSVDSDVLPRVETVTDLGIVVDRNLKFAE